MDSVLQNGLCQQKFAYNDIESFYFADKFTYRIASEILCSNWSPILFTGTLPNIIYVLKMTVFVR